MQCQNATARCETKRSDPARVASRCDMKISLRAHPVTTQLFMKAAGAVGRRHEDTAAVSFVAGLFVCESGRGGRRAAREKSL